MPLFPSVEVFLYDVLVRVKLYCIAHYLFELLLLFLVIGLCYTIPPNFIQIFLLVFYRNPDENKQIKARKHNH